MCPLSGINNDEGNRGWSHSHTKRLTVDNLALIVDFWCHILVCTGSITGPELYIINNK